MREFAIGVLRTRRIGLFPDHEKEREIAHLITKQPFRGYDHRRDDSLRVTGSSAIEMSRIFKRREERRNRVEVRTQHHTWMPCRCSKQVEAPRRNFLAHRREADGTQHLVKKLPDLQLRLRN